MLPTTPPGLTQPGTILGTVQYMTPEQLEGRDADTRTDIFAFGTVLYEMVTGKKAFEGKSQASLIAAILERDPPVMSMLQPLTPHLLDRIVSTCLAKDPDNRWQTARDLLRALTWVAEGRGTHDATVSPSTPRARMKVAGVVALSLLLAGITGGIAVWLAVRLSPPSVARLTITPVGSAALAVSGLDRDVAISPDGSRIAYVGGNGSRLFVRALDQIEPKPLEGVGVPHHPFFSPDGAWIGFFDGLTALKKVAINGGPAVTICRVTAAPRGASWGGDDTVIFALQGTTGLFRVPANGGEPEIVTTPNVREGETFHDWPEFLPEGRGVLFEVGRTGGRNQIDVLDLRTGNRKVLVRDAFYARYVPTGHLLYGGGEGLRAVPFDLDRLELTGTPIPVLEPILKTPFGLTLDLDISRNGTLVYVTAGQVNARTLAWVDRQGQEDPIKAPARAYTYPRLSPDGARLALDVRDQDSDVWIWDFARETLSRFTFGPAQDLYPVWTRDGRRLIFASYRGSADSGLSGSSSGSGNLFWQAADGAGTAEQLTRNVLNQSPHTVSADGTRIVFREDSTKTGQDLMLLTLNKERQVQPLVQTPFNELNAEISPDGRWFAYESNESGEFEIYVRPFPDATNGRWQVSTGGGTRPLWARNGQEIFYLSPSGALMAARVERGVTFSAGTPVRLFERPYYMGGAANAGRTYDVSPDGRRFLMMKADNNTPAGLVVVLNWFEELKRLVPVP